MVFDMLEIKGSSIDLEEKLGEGSFGTVYKANWESRKYIRDVAIKIIKTLPRCDVYKEANLLTSCNHKHIVKCFGVVEGLCAYISTGIVMEYMSLGDLDSYLQDNEQWFRMGNNKWLLQKICYQIALAMEFLECIGIVHRDLAARNVLVEETTRNEIIVKVSDFGLARFASSYYLNYNSPVPFRWSAPEVLHRKSYTHKSDVWAFGVTIWEVYSFEEMPYGSLSNRQVERFIDEGNRLEWPSIMPWTVRKCLENSQWYDPEDRWSFEEIVDKFQKYFDRRSADIQTFYYS